jgi:hypothetical protein
MREIKFRGLSLDGKWIYGDLNPQGENHVNLATFFANLYAGTIRAETVGEWTGLPDKNGKEIYEGDISECNDMYGRIEYRTDYQNSGFCFVIQGYPYPIWKQCIVIGNIYENPELVSKNDSCQIPQRKITKLNEA